MYLNYLLRDKLQYELCIRRVNSEADVSTLRKLRSLMAENILVALQHLKDVGIEHLYAIFSDKVAELQAQSSQPGSNTQAFVIRTNTMVSHLRARLNHLVELGPWPESITMSDVSLLHSSLDSILQCVTSLEEEQEQEVNSRQPDAMKEKHSNAEGTQEASVVRSDAFQEVGKEEREKGSIATDHGNMTHLSMTNQVTGVPQVAANTKSMALNQI
jgi:hypothetical protein